MPGRCSLCRAAESCHLSKDSRLSLLNVGQVGKIWDLLKLEIFALQLWVQEEIKPGKVLPLPLCRPPVCCPGQKCSLQGPVTHASLQTQPYFLSFNLAYFEVFSFTIFLLVSTCRPQWDIPQEPKIKAAHRCPLIRGYRI